jgi:hypothetical protein
MRRRNHLLVFLSCLVLGLWLMPAGVLAADDALPVKAAAAWKAIQAEHPGMRLSVRDGRVTRLFGDLQITGVTPEATRDAFLAEMLPALGVSRADLQVSGPQDIMRGKFTAYYLDQVHGGIPVEGSYATLLVRNELANKLVLASTALTPTQAMPLPVRPGISTAAARQAVQNHIPGLAYYGPAELLYHRVGDTYHLTYAVIADRQDWADPFRVKYYVDAQTGRILDLVSLIYYEDVVGHCQGYATPPGEYPDEPAHPPVMWDLADLRARILGGNLGFTDESGDYVISNSGTDPVTVRAELRGHWVNVNNAAGTDIVEDLVVTPPGPADFTLNPTPAEYQTAQVNGFIHTTIVHDFVKAQNPSYPGVDTTMACNVNIEDDTCNGWYDGLSINFYHGTAWCRNFAYSSVIYHEYGHHVVASGHSTATGAYHEGMADTISCMILNSPYVGRNATGPGTYIRNIDTPNQQYPCTGEDHTCGKVLSGAVWDTKKELINTEGSAQALAICSDYAINSILLRPADINPDITVDWLTLDDDNGDINDGTPHYAEIAAGFGNHNLDAPQILPLDFNYPQGIPTNADPQQGATFRVEVSPISANPQPGTGMLHYRVDGGSFTSVPMDVVSDNVYDATLPGVDCLSMIDWYVSAQTVGGTTIYDPTNAPTDEVYYVTVSASESQTVLHDDFENNLGWTVGAPDDTATLGIWWRADPYPTSAQPGDDITPDPGIYCWVTDFRQGYTADDFDVDGGKTTVTSPLFDVTGGEEAFVSYWLWYSNDEGEAPNEDVFKVDVSDDGGANWVNAQTVGPSGPGTSGGWFQYQWKVSDFVGLTNQVKLRFVASDYGSDSLVEAAFDEFLIMTVTCGGSCPGDINGDGYRNVSDFTLFAGAYGSQIGDPNYDPDADLNGNGFINATDFTLFAGNYGVPCP